MSAPQFLCVILILFFFFLKNFIVVNLHPFIMWP